MGYTKRERRFWEKVARGAPDDCWPWLAATARGVGVVRDQGRNRSALHVAWEIANKQPLSEQSRVRHTCATLACVNPAHLEAYVVSVASRVPAMRNAVRAMREELRRRERPVVEPPPRAGGGLYAQLSPEARAAIDAQRAAVRLTERPPRRYAAKRWQRATRRTGETHDPTQ